MSGLPDGYCLRDQADPVAAHAFLTRSVWAQGITLEQVDRALSHSLVVSVWTGEQQVAMARVLTDYVSLAYLNDVYVLPDHRGQGLARAMLAHFHGQPSLAGVGRWALFTQDAQPFYAKFGWREYPFPERMMIIDPRVFPA